MRTCGFAKELEMAGAQGLERRLDGPRVAGEDHRPRRRGRGEVLGLRGERGDPVEQDRAVGHDVRGHVDSVVADLPAVEALELLLTHLEEGTVRPGSGRALDVQPEAAGGNDVVVCAGERL